jgi:putative addiction module killer protein
MEQKPRQEHSATLYCTKNGTAPFNDWLFRLKDPSAQARITKAIKQMEAGNFGDTKMLKDCFGVLERRIHFGPGYRIYYAVVNNKIIILFAGSDKSRQKSTIAKVKTYYIDYVARGMK